MSTTPRPWHIDPLKLGTLGDIRDSEGNAIAQVSQRSPNPDAERAANTELIVRAVNAHDDLVAALKQADLQIEYMQSKFKETGTGNAVRSDIRAALMKAGAK